MHVDIRELKNNASINGTICIVGAGAAGISLALEFIGTSQEVILLESGGFEWEEDTQLLNKGYNIGQKYFPLASSRLRFFGGTTGHWAGWCAPLDPIDFEKRDWVPYSGWPFSKEVLDPFYEWAHVVCELGPYQYETEYWEAKKQELKSLPFDPEIVQTKMWQKSPPTRFGEKYRSSIVNAPNVHLYTHANLTQIVLNDSGTSVDSLVVKTLDGKVFQVHVQQYVLACGALQNVRYLLHSNQVMKTGVGNQNDLLGRFFMEHPHVNSADMVLGVQQNMDLYYESFLTSESFGNLVLSESCQRKEHLLNYSANLQGSTFNAERLNLMDWISAQESKFILTFMEQIDASKKAGKKDEQAANELYIFSTRIEQAPNPESRVTLSHTSDALGIPHVSLNWQLTDLDKRAIKQANLIIGNELGKLGLGRLRLEDWLFEEDPAWPGFLAGGFHHMGVTRMHLDEKQGVVDANCKVHGLPNLYIAGSSVFPTSGIANPTLTIVALAIRLADHIKSIIG